jgi:hypothetical protein
MTILIPLSSNGSGVSVMGDVSLYLQSYNSKKVCLFVVSHGIFALLTQIRYPSRRKDLLGADYAKAQHCGFVALSTIHSYEPVSLGTRTSQRR